MFCKYCGKKLEEGEVCSCRNKEPIRKKQKSGWNRYIVLSLLFSIGALFSFIALRVLLANKVESGEIYELLSYLVPGVLGVFACILALISFKDIELWSKSLTVLVVAGLITALSCYLIFGLMKNRANNQSAGDLEYEEPYFESDSEKESEEESEEDSRETTDISEESEEISTKSEVEEWKNKYEAGNLDYIGVKQMMEEIEVAELEGKDVDIFLELQQKVEQDLENNIEDKVEKGEYAEAYTLLAKILEGLPNDKKTIELQEKYEVDCLLYLQDKSQELMKAREEKKARKLLEDAKAYYPDESMIDDLLEKLDEMKEQTNEDYIIPDSDSRYLTEEDIEDLSLQEINYAKNEIYARYNRKFDSEELQEYFDSKSWYDGTVEPAEFDTSIFNKYEKQNTQFLHEEEFRRDKEGYKLDQ